MRHLWLAAPIALAAWAQPQVSQDGLEIAKRCRAPFTYIGRATNGQLWFIRPGQDYVTAGTMVPIARAAQVRHLCGTTEQEKQ